MSLVWLLAAGLIAGAVAALALVRPRVALLLLVVFDVANLNGVIADQVGVSPYRAQLALATVALLIVLVRSRSRLSWSPVLLGVAVLFAGFAVSLVGAASPSDSLALLASRLRDLFYFVVVYALLLTTRAARPVAQAVVVVLAGLAALTVVHELVLGNRGDLFGLSRVPLVSESGAATPRHAGTSSDVNFWGRLLIMFTPLAFSLGAAATRRSVRLVWAGCAVSLVAGVYLTQSRGGFLALFLAVVVWLAVAGGWYRRSLLLMPVVVAVLVPISGIGARLSTLTTSGGTADPSVVERRRLQVDAAKMFLDRPLTGHGIGSYPSVFRSYDRLADSYQPVDIEVAAHNLYLEQVADGGIVLFLAWALFVGSVLFAAVRSLVIGRRAGDALTAWLPVGVISGLAGWLLASAFLHLSDFRALLVLAALAAALDVRARDLPPAPALPRRRTATTGRLVAAGLLAVLVLGGAGVGTSLLTGRVAYRTVATLAVVPAATSASGSNAYQLDVVSRGIIVPTLATVLQRTVTAAEVKRQAGSVTRVDVSPSSQGGAVLVEVTTTDPRTAESAGRSAVALAKQETAALATGYQLSGEPGATESSRPVRRWLAIPCGLAMLLSALALIRVRRGRDARLVELGDPTNEEIYAP
jgi:O-antigen ligase